MTEMDENDNYPLPDDWKGHRAEQFERLWREHFKSTPPLDKMTAEECERFHEFAWKVYETAIMESKEVQKLLNVAYQDGVADGEKSTAQEAINKLESVIESLR